MTLDSHYGSTLHWWAMDNPHPSHIALVADIQSHIQVGDPYDTYRLMRDYEDPRFDYVEGAVGWGGSRFRKGLKPEYRAEFDEWCLANAKGQFDHDKESLYLSMGGFSDTKGMFITVDPVGHPPPV